MPGKEQPSVKTSLIDDTVDSFFKNLGESNCVRQVYEGEIWIGTEINIKGNKINLEDVAGPLRIRRIEVCTKGLMFTVEVFDSNIKARSFFEPKQRCRNAGRRKAFYAKRRI